MNTQPATPQQRLVSMKATLEHAIELANSGRQEQAEKLLADFLADPAAPYPPHATICNTCKTKSKVPAHSSGHGISCLNCGSPS